MKKSKNVSNIEMVQSYLDGERPITQVGYKEAEDLTERQVGDIWTDSKGNSWKKTEYGKVSSTPIIDMVNAATDGRCSCCKKEIKWGSEADAKIFPKTGMCLDCLVDFENELRKQGKLHAYAQKKIYSNERSYIFDVQAKIKQALDFTKDHKVLTFVNANGLVEEWDAGRRDDLLDSLEKDYKKCLTEIDRLDKQIAEADVLLNAPPKNV